MREKNRRGLLTWFDYRNLHLAKKKNIYIYIYIYINIHSQRKDDYNFTIKPFILQ